MGNVVGIDLGTTYSAISKINQYGAPEIVSVGDENENPGSNCTGAGSNGGLNVELTWSYGTPQEKTNESKSGSQAFWLYTKGCPAQDTINGTSKNRGEESLHVPFAPVVNILATMVIPTVNGFCTLVKLPLREKLLYVNIHP